MNNWNQSGRDERQEEKPPYSRLFVVCGKHLKEEDLLPTFVKYGKVEDLHMPKDRNTGESRGVVYVKYNKTSSAANAIQALNMTKLHNADKPLKVMVASNKNEPQNTNESKYKRIFIKVPKTTTENEIRHYFSDFGDVESVRLQRDRATDECKGFGYVHYKTFLGAARAIEECDKKYKPVFAVPYDELKRSRTSLDGFEHFSSNSSSSRDGHHIDHLQRNDFKRDPISSLIKAQPADYVMINVTCNPPVHQKFIEKLFSVIPGLTQFNFTPDKFNSCKAIVTYSNETSAAYAVEKLNQFEYPSGEILTVKPEYSPLSQAANSLTSIANDLINSVEGNPDLLQLANAIAQASTLIKEVTSAKDKNENTEGFCSVPLPPIQPMASINSRVACRCFLVFKPHPLPVGILKDAFCRFGDLIDVSTFPNKTFGFAKYASVKAAKGAIATLHQATLCGVKLKVLQADEKPSKDKNNEEEPDTEIKRMKLSDSEMTVTD